MKEHGFIQYSAVIEEENVVLSVYDDGAGMSQEAAAALTKQLDRIEMDADTSDSVHGIGLLNVCRRLHLLYPGRVFPFVESEEGEYSRVGFVIKR